MQTTTRTTLLVAAAALLSCTALLTVAGPLSPPAGPVAPAHKTLAEVEPRIAISLATTPGDADSDFKISQPGSYYLTGDVAATKDFAIAVFASDVVIDLNGFTLRNAGASNYGVMAVGAANLVVRNGSVRGFTDGAIYAITRAASVEGVRVTVGFGDGVELLGDRSRIIACSATGTNFPGTGTGDGLQALGEGSLVESSSAIGFDRGIAVGPRSTVSRCRVSGCTFGIDASTDARLADSVAYRNTSTGFDLDGNASVEGCVARQNGRGFDATGGSTLAGCTALFNAGDGFAIAGSIADACTSYDNGDDGIQAGEGSLITRCMLAGNTVAGLNLGSDCTAEFNACDGNLSMGINVAGADCRVDANSLTDNPTNLNVASAGNFIARNSASGALANYTYAGAQTAGGTFAAAGSIVTNNPYANFTY